jgi:hypothetical protein
VLREKLYGSNRCNQGTEAEGPRARSSPIVPELAPRNACDRSQRRRNRSNRMEGRLTLWLPVFKRQAPLRPAPARHGCKFRLGILRQKQRGPNMHEPKTWLEPKWLRIRNSSTYPNTVVKDPNKSNDDAVHLGRASIDSISPRARSRQCSMDQEGRKQYAFSKFQNSNNAKLRAATRIFASSVLIMLKNRRMLKHSN